MDPAFLEPAGVSEEACILRLDRPGPNGGHVLEVLRAAGHPRPLKALAAALAASPPAGTLENAVLGVRDDPDPVLVFAGEFDEPARARLRELPGLLDEAAARLRFLGWEEVEDACTRLAGELEGRLGSDELARATLVGLPRGGLVVAGLLAYALRIDRARVRSPGELGEDADPVILVDDCVLSGVRLRETLGRIPSSRIVVAPLCSHPDLRARVEESEERVVACVSGLDLHDHAGEILGPDAEAWRARWAERVPGRYHTALLDLVVFPWSQPQIRLWNEATGEIEENWRLAPPSACLAHRHAPPLLPVQVADDEPGAHRLTPGVVPLHLGEATILVDAHRGLGVALAGSGAELLRAWMATGPDERAADAASDAVAARYGVPVDRVEADLASLIEDLSRRGFLAAPRR